MMTQSTPAAGNGSNRRLLAPRQGAFDFGSRPSNAHSAHAIRKQAQESPGCRDVVGFRKAPAIPEAVPEALSGPGPVLDVRTARTPFGLITAGDEDNDV